MDHDQLLERYRPYVQYDSQESYFADSAAIITDFVSERTGTRSGNELRRADGTLIAAATGEQPLTLDLLGAEAYPDGEVVGAGDYVDEVDHDYVRSASDMHMRPGYANKVHGHAVLQRGVTWLQYWFFYYYNNKSFFDAGLHEGDWEMIQLRLDADGAPDEVTYAQHSGASRASWAYVEKDGPPDQPAPVVYSALGSHASYLRRGKHRPPALRDRIVADRNDGGGRRVRPDLVVMRDPGSTWVGWPGKWGSTSGTFASPRGPHEHEQWRDPGGFHREASPVAEARDVEMAIEPEAPPQVAIEARREGDRVVVGYRVEPVPGAQAPAKLLVSVESRGSERPPATRTYELRDFSAEVEEAAPPGDGPLDVHVSVLSDDGTPGDVVSTSIDG